ncbi:MAG: hypothetical protein CMM25_02875 [Rhodospirillaceae bacterium]|nr:hypothetical protein [Rhodospirillaceae bacterium]
MENNKLSARDLAEVSIAAGAIRHDITVNKLSQEQIDTKYGRIKEKFHQFFDMICRDEKAQDVLTFMANITHRQETGEITKERADVELGQFMAHSYIPQYRDHVKRGQDRLAQG